MTLSSETSAQSPLDNRILLERTLQRAQSLLKHDALLRQCIATEAQRASFAACEHSIEFVAQACKLFANHPCLGSREAKQPYTSTDFADTWARVQALATAWTTRGDVGAGSRVGIMGFASPDWAIADFTCLYVAAVSVPLRTSMSADDLTYVINDAELDTVVCSREQMKQLLAVLPKCPTVARVVCMDGVFDANFVAPAGLQCDTMQALLAHGATLPAVAVTIPGRDTEESDPLMTIVYTSGSTGRPKGALFPESLWSQTFSNGFGKQPRLPQVALGFLPLNHMAGRGSLIHTFMEGGVTYFVQRSDLSTLFDDIRTARPTTMMLVPRISDLIHQEYQARCAREGDMDDPAVQKKVMGDMRHTFLGDRLLSTMVGTAPTAAHILDFIKACFDIPVFNAYGATENGVVTYEDHIVRPPVIDYKLVDVPELAYFTTDKPYPRGELRIKSTRVVPGYLNRPEATAGLRDEDGFMCTGDVVEERGPDYVVWIDRKANVIKLSQGEFVGVSNLEVLFVGNSHAIKQIYIHGNSARAYLLAVVVPMEGADRQAIRNDFDRIGQENGLQGYEVPRDFIVDTTGFTKENGLLTESEKPARQQLKARFGAELEALYDAYEVRSSQALVALRESKNLPVIDKVRRAVAVTLGVAGVGAEADHHSFIQMGGDSLSAVRVSDLVLELCGVTLPVGLVLDATTSIAKMADYVETAQQSGGKRLTFEAAHGSSQTVTLKDLSLERFLPDAAELVAQAEPMSDKPAHNVLLTGATGFLGRFLALELLQHAHTHGGHVVCVVRAANDVAARHRMRQEYAKSGEALLERFDALSDRLHVVAGDLMQPRFGLDAERYDKLASRIDMVLHNGALVNHALTYGQLFEPNVLGTVEIMRFALTDKIKRINFMSTVGVPAGARPGKTISEKDDGAALWQTRPMGGGYATGYATSKWVAEVLLRQLSDQFEVPVQVYRSSMIMAHSRLDGQVNATDMVTRLFHSVITTGLAPAAFEASETDEHFDGSPVDFLACSIAAIACQAHTGYQTYHTVNPYSDDAVGMDSFMDWIETAGYSLERIADYATWYKRFYERLKNLGDAKRAQGAWPIVYRWEHPQPTDDTHLDASVFRAAVKRLTPWRDVPHLTEAYLHQYLKSMATLGMIPAAPSESSARTSQEDQLHGHVGA